MERKQKQLFAYGDYDSEGNLQLCGFSRKWDLKTLDQVHPDKPSTPVVRLPQADQINTEHGFMCRDEYHSTKAEWKTLVS